MKKHCLETLKTMILGERFTLSSYSHSGLRNGRFFLILICVVSVLLLARSAYSQPSAPSEPGRVNDFAEYWAAARLLLAGDNSYSPELVYPLQHSVGWKKLPLAPSASGMLMWNPPWTLPFLLPFGLLSFSTGLHVWLMVHTAILLFCAQQLWRLYGGPPHCYRAAWLITFTFVPTLFALMLGQIGPLVLLGLLGFLHFQEKKQWLRAGAALVLIAIKPHLVYLVWVALILWIWHEKQWRLLVGAIIMLIVASVIPIVYNPSIFQHYVELYQAVNVPQPFDWETPTLGRVLRFYVDESNIALQYLPTTIGLFWFLFYWRRHRDTWRWTEQMPSLLLVSSSTTFFAWTLDQVILLPAVLQAAIWMLHNGRREAIRLALLCYIAMNLLVVAMKQYTITLNEFWCFWIAPALLVSYLMLRSRLNPVTPLPHGEERESCNPKRAVFNTMEQL